MIGKQTRTKTFGKEPAGAQCSGGGPSFRDLDGEAVAYAASFFYIVGSHGCSRKKAKFVTSAFIVARVRVDQTGKVINPDGSSASAGSFPVETTYRLSEVLARGEFGKFFGKDLKKETNGLNVEGVAVIGDKLYVGWRAPSLPDGNAGIAVVSIDALFAPSHAPLSGDVPSILPVPLGADVGVRDLAALPDGRLLILSGPAQEQGVPYGLFLFDPQNPSKRVYLATFEDVVEKGERAKAEALLLLDQDSDGLSIILMFDGPPNGGPREYRVPLK